MTIHKVQGATMKLAEMDLGNSIFEYGQIYVALSRVESLEGLYLAAFHAHKIKANPIVKEFYKRIPEITEEVVEPRPLETGLLTNNSNNNNNNTNIKNVYSKYAYKQTTELTGDVIEENQYPPSSTKIIKMPF